MMWFHLTLALMCTFAISSETEAKFSNTLPSISPRIVGGFDAVEGQLPFQCSLQSQEDYGGHFCGCGILDPNWIITAAHCLVWIKPENFDNIDIVVGSVKRSSGGTHYKINHTIVHKEYDSTMYANDIGLIRVKTPITFNDKVQPIKYSSKEVKPGSKLQVSGWGLLKKHGENPEILQVLNVRIISNDACKKKTYARVHDSQMCSINPVGKGICNADSGGPATLDDELVGLVSFSEGCAEAVPDGYTRIAYLYDWIEKNTKTQ